MFGCPIVPCFGLLWAAAIVTTRLSAIQMAGAFSLRRKNVYNLARRAPPRQQHHHHHNPKRLFCCTRLRTTVLSATCDSHHRHPLSGRLKQVVDPHLTRRWSTTPTNAESFRAEEEDSGDHPLNSRQQNHREIEQEQEENATEEHSDQHVVSATRKWVKNIVIGMSLCPFADRPLREDRLQIRVLRGCDEERLLSLILQELWVRQGAPGTTLVVCPECYPSNFDKYLNVLNIIENGIMPDNDLVGTLQIAPFHPLFQFEGSAEQAADNWTNRSPYPIFHILREDEVAKAVDQLNGDAGIVWKRNVKLLHTLEDELTQPVLKQILLQQDNEADAASRKKFHEILRRFKI